MSVNLDRIVRANVTRDTRSASARSFGLVLIAAYHNLFADRVREYEDPAEMLDDGFTVRHPAYKAAVAFCAQDPRPRSFKVGKRLGTPDQTIRVTPSTPTAAESFWVEVGGVQFPVTADGSPSVAEICAALTLLINADADAIVASGVASTTGLQSITSASFNGVRGDDVLSPPRNLTLTLNAHADWDSSTITVTGLDANGRTITEDFTVPNGGDTVLVGTKIFAQVVSVSIPAQSGTNGTLLVGVGDVFANPDLDITATDNTTNVSISADDAGAWFDYDASNNIALDDQTAQPGTTLATDLAAIRAADPDWYGLIVADGQSHAQIVATAAWMETQVGIYFAHTFDSDVLDDVGSDVASTIRDATYYRTAMVYSRVNPFLEAAAVAKLFSRQPGEADFSFKSLAGMTADTFSSAQVTRLMGQPESPANSKHVSFYGEVLPTGVSTGEAVTLGGMVAGGEWIDVIYGIDFVRAEIQSRVFSRLLSSPRLPFTNNGIEAIASAVRTALLKAASKPYNILDPDTILVEATPLEDVSTEDRQARFYDGLRWDARVQGAIHAIEITGTVRP